jgi:hypothetical protein
MVALAALAGGASGAEWGLKPGTPELASAGPLAFGPDGILVIGDVKAATLFAIDTGDTSGEANADLVVERLNEQIADLVGVSPSEVTINDLAVNPASGNIYVSVSAGTAPDTKPALVRIEAGGELSAVSLENVPYAKVALPDPPADKEEGQGNRRRNTRMDSITDLAYVDGKVIVSGTRAAEAPSTIRQVPFPFVTADAGTSLEIYHGAHGAVEVNATPRVFVPFSIDGEPSLLAGFTCTPLVKFPISALEPETKVRGTTVAELGNRNRPLDMIVYEKDGKTWLLMANNNRGVMKISTEEIGQQKGISEPVTGGGTAGQPYETIKELTGIVQLDKLNESHAVILAQAESGAQDLRTIELP